MSGSHEKIKGSFSGIQSRQQPDVPKQDFYNCICTSGSRCKEAQILCSAFLFSKHLCGYMLVCQPI